MIASQDEYERTREYAEHLQRILVELRAAHSAHDYAWMSKAYLKELTKAQREIAMYLALPEVSDKAA